MPPFGAAKQNANSQAELKRYCKARAEALSLGDPKNLSWANLSPSADWTEVLKFAQLCHWSNL